MKRDPQETIRKLEIIKGMIEWDEPLEYCVAIDEAIEALEKQIPKKPSTDGTYTVEDIMQCPSCNGFVLYHKGISYCEKCGQAIDWTEGEE